MFAVPMNWVGLLVMGAPCEIGGAIVWLIRY
jgi:hypothetical protein